MSGVEVNLRAPQPQSPSSGQGEPRIVKAAPAELKTTPTLSVKELSSEATARRGDVADQMTKTVDDIKSAVETLNLTMKKKSQPHWPSLLILHPTELWFRSLMRRPVKLFERFQEKRFFRSLVIWSLSRECYSTKLFNATRPREAFHIKALLFWVAKHLTVIFLVIELAHQALPSDST